MWKHTEKDQSLLRQEGVISNLITSSESASVKMNVCYDSLTWPSLKAQIPMTSRSVGCMTPTLYTLENFASKTYYQGVVNSLVLLSPKKAKHCTSKLKKRRAETGLDLLSLVLQVSLPLQLLSRMLSRKRKPRPTCHLSNIIVLREYVTMPLNSHS